MDLFWKKITGRLWSTRRQERKETSFLMASARTENARLSELKKNPEHAGKYRRNKKFRDVRLTFRDEFDQLQADGANWKPGFYFPNEKMVRHYSFANEQQWNNQGKNTRFSNSLLQIYTRRENAQGLAWHPVNGFAEKRFPFTADVLQSAETFKQQGGIFKAKIRCTGNLHHAFWLGTARKQPHINIFHFNGANIQMGYAYQDNNEQITVKGIKPQDFYIYGFEWTRNELIWTVNNVVVLRKQNTLPNEQLYLVFNSFIPERSEGDEGILEVDWVRVYQFNT